MRFYLYRQAYQLLVQAIPHVHGHSNPPANATATIAMSNSRNFPTVTTSTVLDEVDHPNVRWWTKISWTNRVDQEDGISIQGDDDDVAGKKIKSTDYLEDDQGIPISESDRRALYSHAQLIWTSFASAGNPPSGFKMADIQYLTQYRNEMEKEFPILRLCSRHWKTDNVWILNYPSWLRNWEKKVLRNKEKTMKTETETQESQKRKYSHDENVVAHKKQRLHGKTTHHANNVGKGSEGDANKSTGKIIVVRILIHCLRQTQNVWLQPLNPLLVATNDSWD